MSGSTAFGQVELDLLARHAGADLPFPLRIPAFGRIPAERDELYAVAADALRLRGLADENGPAGVAADVVAALAGRRGTLDLVLTGEGPPVGFVAVVGPGPRATVFRQVLDGDPETLVGVRRVPLEELAGGFAALVPELPGGRALPVRLPVAAVAAAGEVAFAGGGQRDLADAVARHGGHPDDVEALTSMLPAVHGGGQLGATRHAGGRDARAGTELSWVDGPSGRLRVGSPGGWVSVNPLRPADLRAAVRELAELARRPRGR